MKAAWPALCAALAASAVQAAGVSPKPGLWDMSVRQAHNGRALPAAARQRVCLSPEDAQNHAQAASRAQGSNFAAGCPRPKMTRDGNRFTLTGSCAQDDVTSTVQVEVMIDREQISRKERLVTTGPGRAKETTVFESQMHFIASDCGDIPPRPARQSKP